jgi:hypothetical protein
MALSCIKSVKTDNTMVKQWSTKHYTENSYMFEKKVYFDTSIIIQLNVAEYIPPKNENVIYILLIDNLYPWVSASVAN